MTLKEEDIAKIYHMHQVAHLSVNAISERLGVHHRTVRRALEVARGERVEVVSRRSSSRNGALLREWEGWITSKLTEYPEIKSPRLRELLKERGVKVSEHSLRRFVKEKRASLLPSRREAFLKLSKCPGEEAQVDWASFGKIDVGCGHTRRLSVFVMVLSYSRALFARFYVDESLESFLSAHVEAFRFFEAVPHRILYDNLKAAVIRRFGKDIVFNGHLLSLAGRYRFDVRACNVRSGWEKGRVERSVQYLRTGFFPARSFTSLEDANHQLMRWLTDEACQRPWPENKTLRVIDAFEREYPHLQRFDDDGHEITSSHFTICRKTPYIQFDSNFYSIPHRFVGRPLEIRAAERSVRIFADGEEIASHGRRYSKGAQIDNREHIKALLRQKQAGLEEARHRMVSKGLENADMFMRCLKERGFDIPLAFKHLYRLLEEFPLERIDEAMRKIVGSGRESMAFLQNTLEQETTTEQRLDPDLVAHPLMQGLTIRQHDPKTYDHLNEGE